MNKREVMLGAIVMAGALGLSGCAAGDASGTPTEQLVFVGAGGSYQAAQEKAFIVPFQQQTGIKVTQDQPYSVPKVKAMVEAGNVTWDVMEVLPLQVGGDNCGKYFEKLDPKDFDTTGVDLELITPCSMPDMKSAYLFVYNKDKYGDSPPTSWKDFFDPSFPGQRGIVNQAEQGGLEAALLGDGVDPADLYPIDYDRAFKVLDRIRDQTTFITTGAEMQDSLANGSVDMMLAWPGRAYGAVSETGANLGTVWNQALLYWDAMAIPKGSPNLEAAKKFISFSMTASAQEAMSENTAYAPINFDSKPKIDPAKEQFLPLGQGNGTEILRDMEWWGDNLSEATLQWTNWSTSAG